MTSIRQAVISSLSSLLLGIPVASVPLLLSVEPASSQPQSLSLGQIRQKASGFTVRVKVDGGQGSGIVIAKTGQTYTVVTNAHVVDRGQPYQVQTVDGKTYPARLKSPGKSNSSKDLALLEFRAGVNYGVATLQNAAAIPNQTVFAVGFSVESRPMVVLSGQVKLNSEKPLVGGYQIGFSSSTQSGMSGGALLNASGQVIGVLGQGNIAVLNDAYVYEDGSHPNPEMLEQLQALSLAVPIKAVQQLTSQVAAAPTGSSTVAPQNTSTKYTGILAKVDEVAQQITVKIDGMEVQGSGVIVAKQGDIYYVLTAAHVVTEKGKYNVVRKDQYTVTTPDGERHAVNFSDIKLSGVDLAVLPFTSSRSYPLAKLATQVDRQPRWVFVSGFPTQSNSEGSSLNRLLTTGTKKTQDSNDWAVQSSWSFQKGRGYGLVYSNLSYPGMSGGPVLDVQGRVLGINNASEAEGYKNQDQDTDIYLGSSLGVRISTFVSVASRVNINPNLLLIDTTTAMSLSPEQRAVIKQQVLPDNPPSNTSSALDWLNYGIQFWRLGEDKQAIAAFDKAIQLQPNFYLSYYAKGLSTDNDIDKLTSFEKALKLKPDYVPTLRRLGEIFLVHERYTEALNAYEQALMYSTKNTEIPLYFGQADALLGLHHYSEAILILDQALKIKDDSLIYSQRGNIYQGLKDYVKAIADYTKAIEISPDDSLSYKSRGDIYHVLKDYAKALADFTRAIEIDPNYSSAYGSRADVYRELKDDAKASADYTKAIAAATKDIEASPNKDREYWQRGALYISLKDYAKAISDFTKAIEINPTFGSAYWSRGHAYFNLGNQTKAIADYSKAIAIDPANYVYYSNRGLSYILLKDYANAIADYTKAIEINPNDAESYNVRAGAYLALKDDKNANADYAKAIVAYTKNIEINPRDDQSYRSRGLIYMHLKDYANAISDFNKAIEINPDALTYNLRGSTYSELKDYAKAISDFNKGIEINPRDAGLYISRGLAYLGLEDHAKAISDFSKAIEINPNNDTYYSSRAVAYFNSKNFVKAIPDYTKAIENKNGNLPDFIVAGLYSGRGFCYLELKDYTKAIADYTKAIEISPKDNYYSARAFAYLNSKDYVKAIGDYTKVIEVQPQNADAYNQRGFMYIQLKDYPKAIADFTKAIEINPSDANTYINRGYSYVATKDYINALQDFNKSIAIEPNNPVAYSNRGDVYLSQKNYSSALADFDHSLSLDPKYNQPKLNIGLLKYEQGHIDEAITQWKRVIEIDNTFADAQFALAVALFRKGEPEKAISIAEKALKLDRELGDLTYFVEHGWSEQFVIDTKKFLESPQIQALLSKK